MSKVRLIVFLSISLLIVTTAVHFSQSPPTPESTPTQTQTQQSFGQLPLLFVENQGQWDEQVAYAVQGSDKTLYFTPDGITFALTAPVEDDSNEEDGRSQFDPRRLNTKPTRSQRYTVKLDFIGANHDLMPIGEEQDSAVISYFKGQPDDWQAGLPTYRRIVYPDLWPGIDLIYEGTVNRLKYHFFVHPGADPHQIRLAYRGANSVTLNDLGQLVVETPLGNFKDDTPVAYQEVDGERVAVDMAYVLDVGTAESQPYHFSLGSYDPTLPLILDPVILIYSGYIGGGNYEEARDIALDDSGNAYVVGYTTSPENTFPVTVGPDTTYNGFDEAFIAKVNSDGTALVYAGYIGGVGNDYASGVAVDSSGNAYVVGDTDSDETTFPVTVGPDLTFNGGIDAFVAKVNSAGTGLDYAGYVGGSGFDKGTQLAIDGAGNIYITGDTNSDEVTFPILIGPDLTYNGGSQDAFIAKINAAGTGLIYSGYIGGSDLDDGYDIAIDEAGNAYVTGVTFSDQATFPTVVGPDLTFNGAFDAFVTKVITAGTGLIYSGYIGGSNLDAGLRA